MADRFCIMQDRIDPEKVTLLEDRILLKKQERDKSAGGIWLAGNGIRTEHCYGEVLKVGRGIFSNKTGEWFPIEVEVGETILAMDYAGEKLQDKMSLDYFKIIRDHMIWAKVKLGENFEIKSVEPYANKVLVRVIDTNTTRGGINLPDNHQSRGYCMAQVVKVGPGWRDLQTGFRYPMTVKPGDYICMLRYAGSIVKLESNELRLIEERPYMEEDKQPDILFIDYEYTEPKHV